jgi:hypothetical protein
MIASPIGMFHHLFRNKLVYLCELLVRYCRRIWNFLVLDGNFVRISMGDPGIQVIFNGLINHEKLFM